MKRVVGIVLLVLFFSNPLFAGGWTFAVLTDPHDNSPAYRSVLEEVREIGTNLPPTFEPFDFVVVCGDMRPVSDFDRIFKEIFPGDMPAFFPVRGNHEKAKDVRYILDRILPRAGQKVVTFSQGQENVNYYVDWKNIRLIVLEPYWSSSGSLGTFPALKWVRRAIETAGGDHVFLAFHRPYFPREARADPFWSLLLQHADKVRVVFNGHVHKYSLKRFPDEAGGICVVNAGNSGATGHNDGFRTLVEVRIDGPKVLMRSVRTPDDTKRFALKDQWRPTGTDF